MLHPTFGFASARVELVAALRGFAGQILKGIDRLK